MISFDGSMGLYISFQSPKGTAKITMPRNNKQPTTDGDVVTDIKPEIALASSDACATGSSTGAAPDVLTSSSVSEELPSDATLIAQAEHEYQEDRLLAAARLLRQVQDESRLQDVHRKMLRTAGDCEAFVHSITSSVDHGDGGNDDAPSEWNKQGESHGRHDSVIYYKMGGEQGNCLTARVETPIPSALLVPLLSVLNECELYKTWLPSFEKPRLGVTKSEKLSQTGRVSQVLAVATDSPWPLATREAIIGAVAFDDIDAKGDIGVRLCSLHTGSSETDVEIPPPEGGAVRVDFDGGFLFRKCPENHPAFPTKPHDDNNNGTEDGSSDDEHMLLVSFLMYVDSKINFLPQSLINFLVRTVIGRMWEKFLTVAEDVKAGKRPRHAEAIAAKRACLYDWVEQRVESLFEKHRNNHGGDVTSGITRGGGDVNTCTENKEAGTIENSKEYLSYIQC